MAGTIAHVSGTIFYQRAGYKYYVDEFAYMQDSLADHTLNHARYSAEQYGVLSGYALTANPGGAANIVRVAPGYAEDGYGGPIYATTDYDVGVQVVDIGKYICIYQSTSYSISRTSKYTGTSADMRFTTVPGYMLKTTPLSNTDVILGQVTDVTGGGDITVSTAGKNVWTSLIQGRGAYAPSIIAASEVDDSGAPPSISTLEDELRQVKYEFNRIKNTSPVAGGWTNAVTYALDLGGAFATLPSGITVEHRTYSALQTGALSVGDDGASKDVVLMLGLTQLAEHPAGVERYRWRITTICGPTANPYFQKYGEATVPVGGTVQPDCMISVPINVPLRVYVKAVANSGKETDWITDLDVISGNTAIPSDPTVSVATADYAVRVSWTEVAGCRYEICWTTDEAAPDFSNTGHDKVILGKNARYFDIKVDKSDNVRVKVRAINDFGLASSGAEPGSYPDGGGSYITATGLVAADQAKLDAIAAVPSDQQGALAVDLSILAKQADQAGYHQGLTGAIVPSTLMYRDRQVAIQIQAADMPGTTIVDTLRFKNHNVSLREFSIVVYSPTGAVWSDTIDSIRIYSVETGDDADLIEIDIDDSGGAGLYYENSGVRAATARKLIPANTPIYVKLDIDTSEGSAQDLVLLYTIGVNRE